jgi:hypothetical protein
MRRMMFAIATLAVGFSAVCHAQEVTSSNGPQDTTITSTGPDENQGSPCANSDGKKGACIPQIHRNVGHDSTSRSIPAVVPQPSSEQRMQAITLGLH